MNTIGHKSLKIYQKTALVISTLIMIIMIILWIYKHVDYDMVIFPLIMLGLINFLYSKLYRIDYDENYFYLDSIYRKRKIPVNEFDKIKDVFFLPSIFRIKFNSDSFLFMISDSMAYKKFFSISDKRTDEKLNQKIKETI